ECLELARVADARELEHLRRVDRAAAEDDLAGADETAARDVDADRPRALEDDPGHETAALDVEIRPARHGVQIGARRAQTAAAADRAVEGREPLLPNAVHVVRQRVPGLLNGLEERLDERIRRRPPLQDERAAGMWV